MNAYKRLTKQGGLNFSNKNLSLVDEWGYSHIYNRLAELEDKIEQGTLKEIPEGAVVLTETEYNDLLSDEVKTIERDIAEYWATEEVATVAKELHKEGYRKIDDHAILVLRKAKCLEQKIRKETAEKFADRLKAMAYQSTDWSHGEHPMVVEVDYIDEICEEITDKGVQNGN